MQEKIKSLHTEIDKNVSERRKIGFDKEIQIHIDDSFYRKFLI